MKLYEVTNGYIGNNYVRCYVISDTEEKALELARIKFKLEVDKNIKESNKEYQSNCERFGKEFADKVKDAVKPKYQARYYTNLKAKCLCNNTSEECVIGPVD